jgi:hypothetical protein
MKCTTYIYLKTKRKLVFLGVYAREEVDLREKIVKL